MMFDDPQSADSSQQRDENDLKSFTMKINLIQDDDIKDRLRELH